MYKSYKISFDEKEAEVIIYMIVKRFKVCYSLNKRTFVQTLHKVAGTESVIEVFFSTVKE